MPQDIKNIISGNELLQITHDPDTGINSSVNLQSIIDQSSVATGSDGLIFGGAKWKQLLEYEVSDTKFSIAGVVYSTAETSVTLSTADPTDPRIDVIVANTNGTISVVEGIPAPAPVKPEIDLSTQVEITFAEVGAGATVPDNVVSTDIYLENIGTPSEWDATESTSGVRIALASSNDFYEGTVSIEAANLTNNDTIVMTAAAPVAVNTFDQLTFRIKPTSYWGSAKMRVAFYDGATQVSDFITIKHDALVFDTNVSDWNLFVLDNNDFNFTGTDVDNVRFFKSGGGDTISFFLDNVKYNAGVVTPPSGTGTFIITDGTTPFNVGDGDTILFTGIDLTVDTSIPGTITLTGAADTNLGNTDQTLETNRNITVDSTKTLNIVGTSTNNSLNIDKSGASGNAALEINNTGASSGEAVLGTSDGITGTIKGTNAGSGPAIQGFTTGGGAAAYFSNENSNTNSVRVNTNFVRTTSGTAANGIGMNNSFFLQNSSGSNANACSQEIVLTDVTAGTEISEHRIELRDGVGASPVIVQTLSGLGWSKLEPITAAEASAITPAEGMQVMVSDTDATFTSIGYWNYQNGAWVQSVTSDTNTNIGNTNFLLSENRSLDVDAYTLTLNDDSASTADVLQLTKNGNSGFALDITHGAGATASSVNINSNTTAPTITVAANGTGHGLSITQAQDALAGRFTLSGAGGGIEDVIELQKAVIGSSSAGIGSAMSYRAEDSSTGQGLMGRTAFEMVDTTSGSIYAKFGVDVVGNGASVRRFEIGDGWSNVQAITSTEASALTPAEGMVVRVSDTNGTFTNIGYWQYENGAWIKGTSNIYTSDGTLTGNRLITGTGTTDFDIQLDTGTVSFSNTTFDFNMSSTVASITTPGGNAFLFDVGVLRLDNLTPLRFNDADSSNYVQLVAPVTVSSNIIYTLPEAPSVDGQILSSTTGGLMTWATAPTGTNTGDEVQGDNTTVGIWESGTVAEINTGTDATRVMSIDDFAASDFGTVSESITAIDSQSPVTTGDNKATYSIGSKLDGYDLVSVTCTVEDKGVTGTTDIVIRRWRAGAAVDMLSTAVTIGDEWFAADGTINTANDDLLQGDRLYIDVDAIHSGTAPNGLDVILEFRKP